jgi:hypothetical protein
MRPLPTTILLLSSIAPVSSVSAKNSANTPPVQGLAVVRQGADAIIQAAVVPPGQTKRPFVSQGANHAAAIAIQIVCSKDTPAAQRAAICRSNSPS